jgi:hypothetical protein
LEIPLLVEAGIAMQSAEPQLLARGGLPSLSSQIAR